MFALMPRQGLEEGKTEPARIRPRNPWAPGTVFIIGAGHFGSRAIRILIERSQSPLVVVDRDPQKAIRAGARVRAVAGDGIEFLRQNIRHMSPGSLIVPAIPRHLAFEWLRAEKGAGIELVPVPPEVSSQVPHAWQARDGSLLVSYADFRCPDDCPEPMACTVTGKRREQPLYALLGAMQVPGFALHVIQSRQLAPGLGGYQAGDLIKAEAILSQTKQAKWLLATACKCHGIVTALELQGTGPPADH